MKSRRSSEKTPRRKRGEGRNDCDPLAPERFLAPSDREFSAMLEELVRKLGRKETLQMLSISALYFDRYREGRKPSPGIKRLVWLIWVILLHPDRLKSKWDLLTWGFYHKYPVEWKQAPEDWSI